MFGNSTHPEIGRTERKIGGFAAVHGLPRGVVLSSRASDSPAGGMREARR